MPRWSLWLLGAALLAALLWIGCCTTRSVSPPSSTDGAHAIYLVEHGWHAGIAIARADIPPATWDVLADFPEARYFEVGWGDADYYQADDPGMGTTLKAGMWPTESVLHVAALRDPPAEAFARRTVIRILVSEKGLEALLTFIRRHHVHDEAGAVVPLGSGLYGDGSRFYAAEGRYHALNNSNVWAARGLEEAGCSMAPARALIVRSLLAQTRACGAVIQERN